MGHPPLILCSQLMWPVDAAHSENRGFKSVGSGVIKHIGICRTFRAAIGTLEVEMGLLADLLRLHVVAHLVRVEFQPSYLSVDLVGGGEDQRGAVDALAYRLEQIQRSVKIDIEIVAGIILTGGNGHLGSQVIDKVSLTDCFLNLVRIAYISNGNIQIMLVVPAQPVNISFHSRSSQVIQNGDRFSLLQQLVSEVRADETTATSDEGSPFGIGNRDVWPRDPWIALQAFCSMLLQQTEEQFWFPLLTVHTEVILSVIQMETIQSGPF